MFEELFKVVQPGKSHNPNTDINLPNTLPATSSILGSKIPLQHKYSSVKTWRNCQSNAACKNAQMIKVQEGECK
jgi:hypothetical protein